ncbi:MAG: FG-GAP-like repeat-containing protein [Pirellulaceae bacterium]
MRLLRIEQCECKCMMAADVVWVAHDIGPVDVDVLIDVDLDGDLDILSRGSDEGRDGQFLLLRENLGADVFSEEVRVSETIRSWSKHVFYHGDRSIVIDFDLDGDQDVLVEEVYDFSEGAYFAFENVGGFFQFAGRLGLGESGSANLELGDFNRDGNVDVLVNRSNPFTGSSASLFVGHEAAVDLFSDALVPQEFPLQERTGEINGNAVFFDFDADGDLDVVSTHNYEPWTVGSSLSWYENIDNVFSERQLIATRETGWDEGDSRVAVGDVTGDGFDDIIWMGPTASLIPGTADGIGMETVLFENVARCGTFLADFDLDSDMDIMCYRSWYENLDGAGNFSSTPTTWSWERRVGPFDYDLDGDIDFVGDGAWLENRRVGDANNDGVFDSADLVAVLSKNTFETGAAATFNEGDWNQDGQFTTQDLVFAFQFGTYLSAPN